MVSIVKAGSSTGSGAAAPLPISYTPDSGDQSNPDFTNTASFNTTGITGEIQGLDSGLLVSNGTGGGGDSPMPGDIQGALVNTGNAQDPYGAILGNSPDGNYNVEIGNAGGVGTDSQVININPATGASTISSPIANQADDSWQKFGTVAAIAALPVLGGLNAAGEFGAEGLVGGGLGVDATGVAGAGAGAAGGIPGAYGADSIYAESALAADPSVAGATAGAAGGVDASAGGSIPGLYGANATYGAAALDPSVASSLGIDAGSSYLPATGAADLAPISGDTATSLGVSAPATGGSGASIPGVYGAADNYAAGALATGPGDSSFLDTLGSKAGDFFSNPKNDLSLGLGLASVLEGTSTPKLPAGAQTASTNATALNSSALGVINSGGYSAPGWATQKASIDASINQQIQQQTEALEQNAANSGQTGMVQSQQINALKQNLETQRQQLYAAALQQNVQDAIAEYTGSNSTLLGVSQLQYQQSAEAKQAAAQMAALAAKLYGLTGSSSSPTTATQQ